MAVVVVDDDPALCRALTRILSDHVVSSYLAPPPRETLAAADVVIADWRPHGPATVVLCRAVGVPAVVLTASPEDVPREIAARYEVLEKPASRAAILAALARAVPRDRSLPAVSPC